MSGEKKEERYCTKIELVDTYTMGEGGREGVYVLNAMEFTFFPTCHFEISPLKAIAELNTGAHQQRRVQG